MKEIKPPKKNPLCGHSTPCYDHAPNGHCKTCFRCAAFDPAPIKPLPEQYEPIDFDDMPPKQIPWKWIAIATASVNIYLIYKYFLILQML